MHLEFVRGLFSPVVHALSHWDLGADLQRGGDTPHIPLRAIASPDCGTSASFAVSFSVPGPAPLSSPIIAKGRSCYLRVPDFHICTTRGALQLSRALPGEVLRKGRAEGPRGAGAENSPPWFSRSWKGPTRGSRPAAGSAQPSRTRRHRPCEGRWQLGVKRRRAPS